MLIPLPFNFNSIDILYNKNKAEVLKKQLIKDYGLNNKISIFELKKNSSLELNELSDFIYKNIYYYYSFKQWGMEPSLINPNIFKRVPISLSRDNRYFQDRYQILPKSGYTKIFENMLNKPNIEIKLNSKAKDFLKIEKEKVFYKGKVFSGILIYTGSIDELLDYKYGVLPYRSLKFVKEKLNQKVFQELGVVNYPQKKYKFTRITEYKHFMNNSMYNKNDKNTIIVKEYPIKHLINSKKGKIPYYPIEIESNIRLYNKYKSELQKIPNIYIIGRLAEYKYYNMDEIIERAFKLYEKIKKRKSFNNSSNL